MRITTIGNLTERDLSKIRHHFPSLRTRKNQYLNLGEFHFVYCIINRSNSKFYIGKHTSKDIPKETSRYHSSSKYLHSAIKKYGTDSFVMLVLKYFASSKEAFRYEAKLVTSKLVKSKDCYNVQEGGEGFSPQKAKKVARKRVLEGTHNFQTRPDGTNLNTDRVELGIHQYLTRSDGSSVASDRVKKGTHPFQTRSDGSSLAKDRVAKGTNPFQTRPDGTNLNMDRVSAGTHPFLVVDKNGDNLAKRRALEGSNPFCGKKSWNNTASTSNSLFTWYLADVIYKFYLKFPKYGQARVATSLRYLEEKYNIKFSVTGAIKNMLIRFKEGWIPKEDSDWIKFKRDYKRNNLCNI